MNRWGEKMKIVTKADIVAGLQEIGLKEGNTVIVHTSLSSIGYVCGGAQTVIEALIEVVGENGTIMMPTQSWKNLDPEAGVHWDVSEQDWDTIRENWPAYDKKITPTNTMGAVAEMFRSWPGASRSDHPARSVAAWGRTYESCSSDPEIVGNLGTAYVRGLGDNGYLIDRGDANLNEEEIDELLGVYKKLIDAGVPKETCIRFTSRTIKYDEWTANKGRWNDTADEGDEEARLSDFAFIMEQAA